LRLLDHRAALAAVVNQLAELVRPVVLAHQVKVITVALVIPVGRIMVVAAVGVQMRLVAMERLCLAVTAVAAKQHQFQAQAQAMLAAAAQLFTIQRLAVLLAPAVLEAAGLALRQQAQQVYMVSLEL
jgi:hypothetical protein